MGTLQETWKYGNAIERAFLLCSITSMFLLVVNLYRIKHNRPMIFQEKSQRTSFLLYCQLSLFPLFLWAVFAVGVHGLHRRW